MKKKAKLNWIQKSSFVWSAGKDWSIYKEHRVGGGFYYVLLFRLYTVWDDFLSLEEAKAYAETLR